MARGLRQLERAVLNIGVRAPLRLTAAQKLRQLGDIRRDPPRFVARECGVGTGTVQRVKQEMKAPFAVVAA